jgi:hypothetical protein
VGILSGSVGVKLACEDVDLIDASGSDLVVEGTVPLKPGAESTVEISGGEAAQRLRGRIVSCEIVGLSRTGPRYRIALLLNRAVDLIQHPSIFSPFEMVNVELGEPDPALAANSW